jgi:FtsH-binding integral membrane protein
MKTFDRIWTALAVALVILPFVALGFELVKSESPFTIAMFAVMGALLFGTFILGMRVKPESPGDAQDAEAEPAETHAPVEMRR